MRYFLDTEFIEGFHKPLFGKRRHFIDLISIGVVCEDGREYYAVSKDFSSKDADQWVKENVISKLPERHADQFDSPRIRSEAQLWKSNKQIAEDVLKFFGCWQDQHFYRAPEGIEVYAHYADYDWVLFCALFGKMMDLPKGFPMYCRDLKQMIDESGLTKEWKEKNCPDPTDEHNALADAKWNMNLFNAINRHLKSLK
jgi:hypothetical protein